MAVAVGPAAGTLRLRAALGWQARTGPRIYIAMATWKTPRTALGVGGALSFDPRIIVFRLVICLGPWQPGLPCRGRSLRFYKHENTWKASHGSLAHTAWGQRQRTVWLAERPARRGGTWGIGCLFCAHLINRLAHEPEEKARLPATQLRPIRGA